MMKKKIQLISLLILVGLTGLIGRWPIAFPQKAIIEKWHTNTGLRDSITLWGYQYGFVIAPTNHLIMNNGLIEMKISDKVKLK